MGLSDAKSKRNAPEWGENALPEIGRFRSGSRRSSTNGGVVSRFDHGNGLSAIDKTLRNMDGRNPCPRVGGTHVPPVTEQVQKHLPEQRHEVRVGRKDDFANSLDIHDDPFVGVNLDIDPTARGVHHPPGELGGVRPTGVVRPLLSSFSQPSELGRASGRCPRQAKVPADTDGVDEQRE
jgi:hypothetical protein